MKQPAIKEQRGVSKNEAVFKLLTLLIPVFIFLLFEGSLRIAGFGDELDLFIQNPIDGYEKYMMVNPDVGKKNFQRLEYTSPGKDIFFKEKPENTFRLFVMGSSVVYGFPYERNLMFSRILHKQLQDAYPGKHIEMVNTAITAINSFTLLDFTRQILKQEPDAILVYAGHNEFYGAFGIGSNETMSRSRTITKLHLRLMDLRIYQFLRKIIASAGRRLSGRNHEEDRGTLMKRIVGNNDILLHSKEYSIGMKNYEQN